LKRKSGTLLVLFQPFNQFLRWAEVRRAMKIIKALSLIYILTIAVIAQQNATVSGTLTDEGKIKKSG
jgi:hypothetical protein